jgi:hypothetical protein
MTNPTKPVTIRLPLDVYDFFVERAQEKDRRLATELRLLLLEVKRQADYHYTPTRWTDPPPPDVVTLPIESGEHEFIDTGIAEQLAKADELPDAPG